eukprot:TRINITY_DN63729_c0_g1_i1.p1 TRINITY_DN63729_c0_g1~~TRINITY_DN63729_c0_g1_i1.p1  ORF type:complete len:676 (+),score=124.55 TRINITY_DN63729_c0_g1_i1:69-2030(+)
MALSLGRNLRLLASATCRRATFSSTVTGTLQETIEADNEIWGGSLGSNAKPSSSSGSTVSAKQAGRRVDHMPLPDVVKQNLYGMGITKLFEIQTKAFEPLLRGNSLVGRSRTGTGKTVAYLLPLLERMRHEKVFSPHSLLILVPTRELCKQVGSAILSLSVSADVALVYGGPSLDSQEQLVRMGASIVVATPGRCARLIERGAVDASNVRMLVVDEADAMMGAEYIGRMEKVLAAVAKRGLQSVLFSASMPPEVLTVISRHFTNYETIDLVGRGGQEGPAAVQTVTHHLCKIPAAKPAARIRVLMHLLAEKMDLNPGGRCIVFVDTAAESRSLLSHPAMDRRARALHGDSTSQDRDMTITAFAQREFDVLITTDIVARGVDFTDVSLVLQLSPPKDAMKYVHRAGRTGRAGQGGCCITLYDPTEQKYVQRVREKTQQKFIMEAAPGPLDIHHAALSRLLEQILSVQPEEYNPFLADAERLLEDHGPQVLATALAVLDSRHADLLRANREVPSLLTGKKGYVTLLVHDSERIAASNEGEVMRIVGSLLPRQATELSIGRIVPVVGGWAIDVDQRFSGKLVEEIRSGRKSAPFEVTVAKSLPRVLRAASRRARHGAEAPWSGMRKRAFAKGGARGDGAKGRPRSDGRWPGQKQNR